MPPPRISSAQRKELCKWAYLSDREIRSDAAIGLIRDEDDYTSNFTSALRRNINCYSKTGLKATSYLLSSGAERTSGCDAAIVIQSAGELKVALFEAKFPFSPVRTTPWDYPQTFSGLSHFSDQLDRQAGLRPDYAAFEMFYCSHPLTAQPAPLLDEVSSCVWHSAASAFDKSRAAGRPPWSTRELNSMLSANTLDIAEILNEICICNHGTPIRHQGNVSGVVHELGIKTDILVIETSR